MTSELQYGAVFSQKNTAALHATLLASFMPKRKTLCCLRACGVFGSHSLSYS